MSEGVAVISESIGQPLYGFDRLSFLDIPLDLFEVRLLAGRRPGSNRHGNHRRGDRTGHQVKR